MKKEILAFRLLFLKNVRRKPCSVFLFVVDITVILVV